MLVSELANERIILGELLIVDATAEPVSGARISSHVSAWRRRLPATKIVIVPFLGQDLRFGEAIHEGLAATQLPNVWITSADHVLLDRGMEYLLKTFILENQQAVVVTQTSSIDGVLQRTAIPPQALNDAAYNSLLTAADFTLLDDRTRAGSEYRASATHPGTACDSFWGGIFGGARSLLVDAAGRLFDSNFVTDAAVADLSLGLNRRQVKLVQTSASAAVRMRGYPLSAAAPWEATHDWRWLLERHKATARNAERIELVCPFHRGDLLLAVQVCGYAASLGIRIRLHTAASLVAWARDLGPKLDVEPIPVPVASPEETYPQLLASYLYVSQRLDASPNLARCHPARSLSDTGCNLLAYMLEQAGLPADTLLPNLKPPVSDEQQKIARQIMQPFGSNVVFLHPIGGWGLKSLPHHMVSQLAKHVHAAGLKLVQIGGPADMQVDACDGAILKDFLPSQWRSILAHGRALVGVDSWTSHFAALLDMPQVTLYGSTHPQHVNAKSWFAEKASPQLVLGPTVSCSPCNSLACRVFPDRSYCTGYSIDATALDGFLDSVLSRDEVKAGRVRAPA